jgi:hypothetical protein
MMRIAGSVECVWESAQFSHLFAWSLVVCIPRIAINARNERIAKSGVVVWKLGEEALLAVFFAPTLQTGK